MPSSDSFNSLTGAIQGEVDYDYIIAGAGCAGLSLLVRLVRNKSLQHKRILLVDREAKTSNDRTWCFWEKGDGYFEELVYKKWDKIWFHANDFSRVTAIAPYQYKMIRGIDFYKYCFDIIHASDHQVTIEYGEVSAVKTDAGRCLLTLNNKQYSSRYLFNSLPVVLPPLSKSEFHLLQHFKGWIINTATPAFSPGEATLMDFRISQERGTSFVYVMPFSDTRALVEYTLFTTEILSQEAYDEGLKNYLKNYAGIDDYEVESIETGVIPMTNQYYPKQQGNIIYIGTAGGNTKPSTGYTFQFIQKESARITAALTEEKFIAGKKTAARFRFYDAVLLNVLATRKMQGASIFEHIFKKNTPEDIFAFLDNESRPATDLKIISSLPVFPFLKAATEQLISSKI